MTKQTTVVVIGALRVDLSLSGLNYKCSEQVWLFFSFRTWYSWIIGPRFLYLHCGLWDNSQSSIILLLCPSNTPWYPRETGWRNRWAYSWYQCELHMNSWVFSNRKCQPRWLSQMYVQLVIRRLRVWSLLVPATFFCGDDHKVFLWSFLPLSWFKKGSC